MSSEKNQFQIFFSGLVLVCSSIFFVLFSINGNSIADVIYGFNTFAFVLAVFVWRKLCTSAGENTLAIAINFAFIGLLVGAGWAVVQHFYLNHGRVSAIAGGGSNLIARVSIFLFLFLALRLMVPGPKSKGVIMVCLGFAACLVILILSGSRGALLAIPIVLVLITVFSIPSSRYRDVKFLVLAVLLCTASVLMLVMLDPRGDVTGAINRLESVINGAGMDDSTAARFEMWQVAFAVFWNNPIFGSGWHSFVSVTDDTSLAEFSRAIGYFNFHSDIANFAVAGGITGLCLYFGFLLAPIAFLRLSTHHPYFRVRLYWALSMPLVYIVLGLTDMVIGYDYPTMFYAFTFPLIWQATTIKTFENR